MPTIPIACFCLTKLKDHVVPSSIIHYITLEDIFTVSNSFNASKFLPFRSIASIKYIFSISVSLITTFLYSLLSPYFASFISFSNIGRNSLASPFVSVRSLYLVNNEFIFSGLISPEILMRFLLLLSLSFVHLLLLINMLWPRSMHTYPLFLNICENFVLPIRLG